MKRICLSVIAAICLMFTFGEICAAQVSIGVPPFASMDNGPFDAVNLGNLNVHFAIPILHKPGRGMTFDYDLTYDSSVWVASASGGHPTWIPASSLGWQGLTHTSSVNVTYSTTFTSGTCGQLGNGTWQNWHYGNFSYTDSQGTTHPVSFTADYRTNNGVTNCPPAGAFPSSATVPIPDGSGYSLIAMPNQGSVTTYIGNGAGVTMQPFLQEDSNGNEITNNGSVYTDTLGKTVLTIAGSGTPASPTTFSYTGPSGVVSFPYTVAYTATPVTTTFNCANMTEYSGTLNLVTSITLPDHTAYNFTYYGDGRIKKVTLPSGGTITYAYTGSNNGINCSDGTTVGLTRMLSPGGMWSYSRVFTGNSNLWTTTEIDPTTPTGNTMIINLAQDSSTSNNTHDFYETSRQVYQGSNIGGTLLSSTYNCWNGDQANCAFDAVSSPIVAKMIFRKLSTGTLSASRFTYLSTGQISEDAEYDWGWVQARSAPISDTVANFSVIGGKILPTSVVVKDGSGNVEAQTTYGYDEVAVTATSGTPQHVTVTGARGNLTSINTYINSTTSVTQNLTYYDTGALKTSKDINGALSTNTYGTGSCGNSFATSVTLPLSLSTSTVWDCFGGVVTSTTDLNGNATITNYTDANFWRPSTIQYPDGGKTTFGYPSPNETDTNYYSDSLHSINTATITDGFGRTLKQERVNDPLGIVETDTTYDLSGRIANVSNPHVFGSPQPTDGIVQYTYDGAGRVTKITNQDSSYQSYNFVDRATEIVDEGNNASGTNHVARIYQNDGLGRTTSVCELSSITQQGAGATPVSCGMDIAATGFVTNYTYDALGNLLTVGQSGLNARTYTYDYISRLKSESNPETNYKTTINTITYSYDSCSVGDLCSRTAPKPNQTAGATVTTSYTYDLLHRLLTTSYDDGVTQKIQLGYDEANPWGQPATNQKGLLTSAQTFTPSGALIAGHVYLGHDTMGRSLSTAECTPRICGITQFNLAYTYNFLGQVNTFTNSYEGVTYTTNYDGAGRLQSLQSSLTTTGHPATLYSVTQYNPLGEIVHATLGNGILRTRGYDSQGRITSQTDGSLYNFSLGFAPDSDVLTGNDSANGNWTYTYDAFNRIASASVGTTSFGYQYDRFGNRWIQTINGTASPSYSFDNNSQIVGSNILYDSAGNVIQNEAGHSFTYDAEGRMLTVDGTGAKYSYNTDNQRVEETIAGGAPLDFIYHQNGDLATELNASTWIRTELFAGSEHVATYANGTTYFMHNDWLGSAKNQSDMTGASAQWCNYQPFGDGFTCPGPSITSQYFTGDFWDPETNFFHTSFRQYDATQGRWMTPDPSGNGSVDQANPQSWNRYSYGLDSPMNNTDSSGLFTNYYMACMQNPGDRQGGHGYYGDVTYNDNDPGVYKAKVVGANSGQPDPRLTCVFYANYDPGLAFAYSLSGANSASSSLVSFLLKCEGFGARAYLDTKNNCTIGYGHLLHLGKCNDADKGLTVTRQSALTQFNSDLGIAVKALNQNLPMALNQGQFDAMASLTFNMGMIKLRSHDVWVDLVAGNMSAIADDIRSLSGGGKGMPFRRDHEADMFTNGVYANACYAPN